MPTRFLLPTVVTIACHALLWQGWNPPKMEPEAGLVPQMELSALPVTASILPSTPDTLPAGAIHHAVPVTPAHLRADRFKTLFFLLFS